MVQSTESVVINEEQNLCAMPLFTIRDLTQLVVLWLYSYIKSKFQSAFVIFQLTCCRAAATSVALC